MLETALAWIGSVFPAFQSWLSTIANGIGFDLIGFLVAATCVSIAIAYLLKPAVGSTGKANSRHNRPRDKEE